MEEEAVETPSPLDKRRKTSLMWYFFSIINDNLAKCKTCNRILSYRSSTSNLKKHLQKSHPPLFNDFLSGRIPSAFKGSGNDEDRSFEVDLEDPLAVDEDYSPAKKKLNLQAKPKSFRLHHHKPAVPRNIVHSYARVKPMVEYDDDDKDEEDNEYELLGKFICSQLQKLSKVNAFLAQEEIQSVLTRYKVHELSTEEKSKMMPNTRISNDSH